MKRLEQIEFNTLTNDPSMRAWGWVVMSIDQKVQAAGCIKTEPQQKKRRIRKGDDTIRRISEINSELFNIITKYKIRFIVSELPHGSQNASAAVMIGMVTGVMQTIADAWDISIEWYSEQDAKKCLLGKISATKEETIEAVSNLYNVPWFKEKYKNEAIADAIAIYHTATKQSSTLKLIK